MSVCGGGGLKGLVHNIILTPVLRCQNFYFSVARVTFSSFSDCQNFVIADTCTCSIQPEKFIFCSAHDALDAHGHECHNYCYNHVR